jgi:2-polyprenyl-3-methyl-5-hydroxy-6-metoxy-1,4-benzoquinol methylase
MPKANKVDKTYLTAKVRLDASAPAKYLVVNNLVNAGHTTLDYGCGHGEDAAFFNWDKYDPHYAPEYPTKKYRHIVCFYVLNVVQKKDEEKIIDSIKKLLLPNGVAYFAVRRDFHRGYISPVKKSRQRVVKLKYPVVKESHVYCIYEVRN